MKEMLKKICSNLNEYEITKNLSKKVEKYVDEINKLTPKVAKNINEISSNLSNAYDAFMKEMKKVRTDEINSRQDANRQILKELSEIVETHPDLRFNQMLYIMSVIRNDMDTFNEESLTTLKHIQAYKESQYSHNYKSDKTSDCNKKQSNKEKCSYYNYNKKNNSKNKN